MPTAATTQRVYGLDWLRVLLVFGVFLFHALHPYDAIPWVIKNDETSFAITGVLMLFFPWGLPVLFLVAGASAYFAGLRRSGRQFAKERTLRLAVPFAIGTVLLAPFQAWVVAQHQGIYQGSLLDFIPVWAGDLPFFFSPAMVSDWGWHLWFLGFLFAFSLLVWPLQRWLSGGGAGVVDRVAAFVTAHRGAILLGVVPLIVVRVALHGIAPEEHGWTDFAYYGLFYVYGIVLLQDPRLLAAVRRDWKLGAVMAVVGVMAIGGGTGSGFITDAAWEPLDGPDAGSLMLNLAMPLAAYGAGLVVVATAVAHLDKNTPLLRYGQSVIVPFYVVHQPVVIAVAAVVVAGDLGFWSKVATTLVASLAITMVLVEAIRRTPGVRAVFGVKPAGGGAAVDDQPSGGDGVGVPSDSSAASTSSRLTPSRYNTESK
ncbi:MAG: acyltransferase family protein [Jiangellales bacterium]